MSASPSWPAPAKLNLYLHVLGRRADGYHELDSLIAFADIGDEIRVEAAPQLSLAVTGSGAASLAGPVEDNLVWRAAVQLAERLGRPPAAALTLVKALPVASGIGGGSSDAAATIRALLALWGASLAPAALHALGLSLGADVPVCLAGRTAFMGGIGEEIAPAPALPPAAVVLVNPRVPLPTPTVFKGRRGPFSAAARFAEPPADVAALVVVLRQRRNDLTASAVAVVPAIATVLARLEAVEGALLARMSGSGATCFALFAAPEAAAAAAARLQGEHPDWWVAAGQLLV